MTRITLTTTQGTQEVTPYGEALRAIRNASVLWLIIGWVLGMAIGAARAKGLL